MCSWLEHHTSVITFTRLSSRGCVIEHGRGCVKRGTSAKVPLGLQHCLASGLRNDAISNGNDKRLRKQAVPFIN